MSKLIKIIIVVGLAVAAGFLLYNYYQPSETISVRLGGGRFQLKIADSSAERIQGLSGVSTLPPNGGMLFAYRYGGQHGIWMKDMKIPLDIVWLDNDRKVIKIVEKADPDLGMEMVYRPETDARYIIELSAGAVAEHAIKLDSVARFRMNMENVE
ncbi:hypothetical protein B7Y94_01130 [Candidatus Saccharibacteria bacterium 32-49-12]|nr:MAG: hypothetical protein B7Y94_01130 [Candidatus Saccharibacteria bacterium 32-49-12]